jgi:hypothetical protein
MEKVENLMYQIESLKNSPEGFLFDYFEKVKSNVDLRREILKRDIDNYSDQMIGRIEKTKKECMELSTQIQDISTLLDRYTFELNKLKNNFNTLDADKLIGMMEESIRQCKYSLLQKKYFTCQFEEIKIENIFGELLHKRIGGKLEPIIEPNTSLLISKYFTSYMIVIDKIW